MDKFQIITSAKDGKFKRNRNLVLDAIADFGDKDFLITLERPKKKRSNRQNDFYWGVVMVIVQQGLKDATGEFRSVNDIHYNILLPMFAPINEIVNTSTGEIISERLTSSRLTTTQFCSYILDIQKWGAEFLGVDIPSPNEEITLNFDN